MEHDGSIESNKKHESWCVLKIEDTCTVKAYTHSGVKDTFAHLSAKMSQVVHACIPANSNADDNNATRLTCDISLEAGS